MLNPYVNHDAETGAFTLLLFLVLVPLGILGKYQKRPQRTLGPWRRDPTKRTWRPSASLTYSFYAPVVLITWQVTPAGICSLSISSFLAPTTVSGRGRHLVNVSRMTFHAFIKTIISKNMKPIGKVSKTVISIFKIKAILWVYLTTNAKVSYVCEGECGGRGRGIF